MKKMNFEVKNNFKEYRVVLQPTNCSLFSKEFLMIRIQNGNRKEFLIFTF